MLGYKILLYESYKLTHCQYQKKKKITLIILLEVMLELFIIKKNSDARDIRKFTIF